MNVESWKLLINALKSKKEENTIKLLINKYVDINKKDKEFKSPLIYALMSSYSEDIIKYLINKKTNIDQKDDNNRYPLRYAFEYDNSDGVKKLLIKKMQIKIKKINMVFVFFKICFND